MLSINMDDVIKVLNSIKSQLIGFGVVAVLLIAVMIACRKQSKSKKYLIRWQAGLGMVLALAITVNLILTGPMYSMVTLATGGGKVSEENVASATQLCENIVFLNLMKKSLTFRLWQDSEKHFGERRCAAGPIQSAADQGHHRP